MGGHARLSLSDADCTSAEHAGTKQCPSGAPGSQSGTAGSASVSTHDLQWALVGRRTDSAASGFSLPDSFGVKENFKPYFWARPCDPQEQVFHHTRQLENHRNATCKPESPAPQLSL